MISGRIKQLLLTLIGTALFALILMPSQAFSDQTELAEEKPYHIDDEGKVDWYTFSGFRRYHAECHVCHGPAGLGSSFAPNLLDSVKDNGYEDFWEVVVNGRVNVTATMNNVMPAFGTNLNVMCFLDDIYAYLYARADKAIGTERPDKQAKPVEAAERDKACLGP